MSTHIPGLFIMESEEKGRGVYTSVPISKGDIIESAPVIILQNEDREVIHHTKLHDYYFLWGQAQNEKAGKEKEWSCALALGYGSLYNHASPANAEYIPVLEEEVMEFVALRDIEAGEEITIDYMDGESEEFELWF